MKGWSILLIFFHLFFGVQSQTLKNTLYIQGKVKIGKENASNVQITFFSEGEVFDQIKTNSAGKFTYKLPLQKNYDMVIYKDGYRSKYVRIIAQDIPDADAAFGYEFGGLYVTLFKAVKNIDDDILNEPVAKIIYDTDKYKFIFDASYFNEIEEEMTELQKEITALQENATQLKIAEEEAKLELEQEKTYFENQALLAMESKKMQIPLINTQPIIQENALIPTPQKIEINKNDTIAKIVSNDSVQNTITTGSKKEPNNLAQRDIKNTTVVKPSKIISNNERKPSEVPKASVIQPSFQKEIYRQGNKTITKVTLHINETKTEYRRVIADWGGRYFFKDEVPITEITWDTELKEYLNELK